MRTNQYPYGGWDGQPVKDIETVTHDTALFVKMIYLHALATAGRCANQPDPEESKEVGFLLEQPQDPRGFLPWDHELFNEVVSFWRSDLWMKYSQEAGLDVYTLDQGALGHPRRKPTSLGTNLRLLSSVDGLSAEQSFDPWTKSTKELAVWAPGLVEAIVKAVIAQGSVPRMMAMSTEQWREHVRQGHLPFRRDCVTCVQAGATGRRHARVEHPDAFVLTADLSGPLKEHGLDSHGRGRAPKRLPYLFVAKLRVPKSFVDDGRGVGLEYDPAEEEEESEPTNPDDGLAEAEPIFLLEPKDGGKEDLLPPEEEEEEEQEPQRPKGEELPEGEDLAAPEMVNLIFATGLQDNKSATVLEAVQDVVYYVRSYNIPILRFHCDRSMEFFAKASRRWIKEQGMRLTCSEGGEHQSNGSAENTVRWVKQRARTVLAASGLPQNLWPYAASYVATKQRSAVLGFEAKTLAPFGAKVLVKKKSYTGAYHGGKLDDLAPRWEEGHYLGLSDAIRHGHLVYIPDEGGRFLHTQHVRHHLHDPGPPEDVLEAEPPPGARRRIRGKTKFSEARVSQLQANPEEAKEELRVEAEKLIENWDMEEAEEFILQACSIMPTLAAKYGLFRYGGVMGVTRATHDNPWFAKLLVKLLQEADPDAEFAAVYLAVDGEKEIHADSHNEAGSRNYIYPLRLPRRGGDLWMELVNGDVVTNKIVELKDKKGKSYFGTTLSLKESEMKAINPRKRHAVLPWKGSPGDRVTVIGYTPARVGSLHSADKELLASLGFNPPLLESQDSIALRMLRANPATRPEQEEGEDASGGEQAERVRTSDGMLLFVMDWKAQRAMQAPSEGSLSNQARASTWTDDTEEEMFLVVGEEDEPRILKLKPTTSQGEDSLAVFKAEVAYTRNIEALLESLTEPIAVVHTVHPAEALEQLEKWIPAIKKELGAIEHAVVRLKKGSLEREQWLGRSGVQLLPMKLVYTIKPPDQAPTVNGDQLCKRKARAVICGNLADPSDLEVYTGAAPAEVVRAALTLASRFGWSAAVLDIISAFLQTPLSEVPSAPVVVAIPPKALVKAQLADEDELWGITHAVYGLRESPRLWGFFRDGEMKKLKTLLGDQEIVLVQGQIEPTWWSIRVAGEWKGILVIYVDDYLILSTPNIIKAVSAAVQQIWKTSALQFAMSGAPIRFLGMEIHVTARGFAISQSSYIQELLRVHNVEPQRRDVVPVSRETASFEATLEEGDYTPHELRQAQQCAGEVLWVSQRSRPDLGFTASLLSSLTTRAPRRVCEVAAKVRGYLQRTIDFLLYIEADSTQLVGYADSSFAPSGERSHSGWVTMLHGVPISWRSSRQTTTSLSTGEAELNAASEGALALLSTQALLHDVLQEPLGLQLESDSTTALSLVEGSGSWRTRHLRIKANWLYEKVKDGQIVMTHCKGVCQPADILTKAMASPRMLQLMELWNIRPRPEQPLESDEASEGRSTPSMSRVLLALMILAQSVVPGESSREVEGQELMLPVEPLKVDRSLATWAVFWGLVLVMILCWELLKWLGWQAFFQLGAGVSERRMRRLQRLREATAEAINEEFARLSREPDAEPAPAIRIGSASSSSTWRRSTEDRATSPRRPGRIERSTQTAAPALWAPDPVPQPVTIRYIREVPDEAYVVPGRPTFHIFERCHAFRHTGTADRVQHLHLCGFCKNHDGRDPHAPFG